jgi:transposase
MKWSGRAPAPQAMEAGQGRAIDEERAVSQNLNGAVAVVGIDNSFHTVGLGSRGAIVLRQKWSRGQVEARFANLRA